MVEMVKRARTHPRRWFFLGLALLGSALIALFTARALEIQRLQAELVQLEAEKAKIRQQIENLSARLKEKDNLKLIEYLARKELGMVKPGEEVYIILEDGEER